MQSHPTQGFYSVEMRTDGRRSGFELVTLDGGRAVLADIEGQGPKVGPYKVNLRSLAQVALPTLEPEKGVVYFVDEIGRMELLSKPFVEAVERLTSSHLPAMVIATIPLERPKEPLILKMLRERGELHKVTKTSRQAAFNDVAWRVEFLLETCDP